MAMAASFPANAQDCLAADRHCDHCEMNYDPRARQEHLMANNRRSGPALSAQTLTELFQTQAAHDPSSPFVLYQDRSWSWAAFDERVQRVAELLTLREVGKGDRVAVVSTNNDHYVALLLAIARIGAIMVPVNPELRAEEMRYVLGHAEGSGVFVSLACLDVCKVATAQLEA